MKRLLIFFFLYIFVNVKVNSQYSPDFGLFVGPSKYFGDANQGGGLNGLSFVEGAFLRINLTKRYSITIQGDYLKVSGTTSSLLTPQFPNNQAFNSKLIDLSAMMEINFLPYAPLVNARGALKGNIAYSPYIATGIAGFLPISGSTGNPGIAIPFAFGNKFDINRNISGGIEFNIRKTFSDNLDGGTLINSPLDNSYSFIHNNDWYTFFKVFIAFKIFNLSDDCPTYNL